ncbi:MAG: TonB-dependent receptor [Ignavibacteria bacterium]|nr:TonB-dependent receptor [Ignavibacteria bacterium]
MSLNLLRAAAWLALSCLPIGLAAQSVLHGRVTAEGLRTERDPLRSATVLWKGTREGTLTSADGHFMIKRSAQTDTLEIRYAGYETQYVVAPTDTIEIVLQLRTENVVTVEADQPTITRAPQKTEMITKKDLVKAACCSLAESFEKNPSVEVSFADAVSGAKQIQLLGLRGLYTQFLIEAVPLVRSLEMPYGLDHVPGPFMESISISKGASTVTNGYESMTGQINICMHDPRTAPSLYVNAYGNTQARFELNLYGAQQITDELSTMTMLHGRIMDMTMDNNNDGFADIPAFKQVNLVHRWLYNNDEIEWQVFVRGLIDQHTSGQSVVGHAGDPHAHDSTNGAPYDIVTDIGHADGFIKFGLLNAFGDMEGSGVSLVVAGAYHDATSTFGLRQAHGQQRTVNVRGVLALPFSEEIKLVGGFSYLYDDVQESLMTNSFSRIERVPGLYAEATLQPVKNVTILAGLRADAHNLYGTRVVPRAHIKWSATGMTSIRASIGRGWRVASVVTENLSSYINSRQVYFDQSFSPEDSWNVGASFTTSFEVAARPITFDAEIYSTSFMNQVVVDYDRSVREVWVTNLNGTSYATNVMAQILVSPIPRLDVLVAYRWVDVQAPYGGIQQQRPMVSRSRVLTTLSYATIESEWQADLTVAWNSTGRLPTTAGNPPGATLASTFPSWWRVNAQITKRFGTFDVYVGIENATNFIQDDPILGADMPYGETFDASLTWGPLDSRMFYAGVRLTIQ